MKWLVLLVPLLFAGCSDPSPPSDTPTGPIETEGPAAPPPAPEPVFETVEIDWDGNLGTGLSVYDENTQEERRVFPVAPEAGFILEKPGATLIALELELTWPSDPTNPEIAFEGMAMGPNSTMIFADAGSSPVAIEEDGLEILLTDDTVFHVYMYAPDRAVEQPPVYAYSTNDVDLHIEGTLTFRLPG